MAVTKKYPSIKTSILVDGVTLEEYDDDEARTSSNTVTKYIEAISGAEFAIQCRFDKLPEYDVRIDFYLDGHYATAKYAMLDDFEGRSSTKTSYGVRSNDGHKWQVHNYAFSNLHTVDSDGRPVANRLMKDLKHMGEITVRLHYVINPRPSRSAKPSPRVSSLKDVPEKALKGRALTHQTKFRAPKPTMASKVVTTDYVDPRKIPFTTFNFKYRSRHALKALMIVPRSPSPAPLEDRDIDTLTPEEMRQLLRRQREGGQAPQAVKQEQRVKQEQGVKRERTRGRSSATYDFDSDDEVSFVSAKRRRHPIIIGEDGAETIDLT
ncbi:hypothetical protein HBH46_051040 [Parastagonospora nodorum]|nr:hypothetical protein HBH46_051040 [Parastagonospora nodorum]KAH4848018.1 hypothetical protein HBH75_156970 [Parastagonospora nodorum]KAH5383620.1 hypothetical protein HBI33_110150 [Parastagonospora nodorum]